VRDSTFPDAELGKVRDNLLRIVQQRQGDPNALANAHVQNLLWGAEHVRGWINSDQSIAALRRDDVLAWHKQWFQPNNSLLVIVGDVDPKKICNDIERALHVGQDPRRAPAAVQGARPVG